MAEGAKGNLQLSTEWINAVSDNIGDDNLKLIIQEAKDKQVLKTGVLGINKADGKTILIPVEATNTYK